MLFPLPVRFVLLLVPPPLSLTLIHLQASLTDFAAFVAET